AENAVEPLEHWAREDLQAQVAEMQIAGIETIDMHGRRDFRTTDSRNGYTRIRSGHQLESRKCRFSHHGMGSAGIEHEAKWPATVDHHGGDDAADAVELGGHDILGLICRIGSRRIGLGRGPWRCWGRER